MTVEELKRDARRRAEELASMPGITQPVSVARRIAVALLEAKAEAYARGVVLVPEHFINRSCVQELRHRSLNYQQAAQDIEEGK